LQSVLQTKVTLKGVPPNAHVGVTMLASSALVPFADGQQPDRASWRAVQHTKVNHRARNNLSEPEVLSRVEAAPGVGMHALLHIDLRGEPRWSHIVGSSPEI
jgi:predicted membrane protein